jgi:hypothetical protein
MRSFRHQSACEVHSPILPSQTHCENPFARPIGCPRRLPVVVICRVDALAARQRLLDCDWRGNVRELQNAFEQAVVFADNGAEIDTDDLRLGRAAGETSGCAMSSVANRSPRTMHSETRGSGFVYRCQRTLQTAITIGRSPNYVCGTATTGPRRLANWALAARRFTGSCGSTI